MYFYNIYGRTHSEIKTKADYLLHSVFQTDNSPIFMIKSDIRKLDRFTREGQENLAKNNNALYRK